MEKNKIPKNQSTLKTLWSSGYQLELVEQGSGVRTPSVSKLLVRADLAANSRCRKSQISKTLFLHELEDFATKIFSNFFETFLNNI